VLRRTQCEEGPGDAVIVFETSWPWRRSNAVQHQTRGLREDNDARTGMPFGMPKGAMCVQRFDDSRKFCNSHYLSHFAAFFIDARTKRSVVESFVFDWYIKRSDSEGCFYYNFGLGVCLMAIGGRSPGAVVRPLESPGDGLHSPPVKGGRQLPFRRSNTYRFNRHRVGRSGLTEETLTR
jgi:hypothetical protein